jgi:hypothetical protein
MFYFGLHTWSEYNNCTFHFMSKLYKNSQLMENDRQHLTDKLMLWCNSQVMESAANNSTLKGKKQCCWGNCNVQTSYDFTWMYDITIMRSLGAQKNHTSSFCTSLDIVDLSTARWCKKKQNMPSEQMTCLVERCLFAETERHSTVVSLPCCHVTASTSMEVFYWFLHLLW